MNSRLKKWMVLTLCLLTLGAAARADGLRVMTEEYAPYNMRLANGKVGGLSSELVQEMFRRAGMSYSIDVEPWITAFNAAVMHDNTCVYSTTRSENREHQFKWVGPLVEDPWALFAGPSSPKGITSLEDVRRYTIGGYVGDAKAQFLIARGFNVELMPTDQLNARKLAAGRIDFWATSKYQGRHVRQDERFSQLKPVLVFNTVLLYLACNPGVPDATIQRLNDILNQMRNEGFNDAVRKRYLGE